MYVISFSVRRALIEEAQNFCAVARFIVVSNLSQVAVAVASKSSFFLVVYHLSPVGYLSLSLNERIVLSTPKQQVAQVDCSFHSGSGLFHCSK